MAETTLDDGRTLSWCEYGDPAGAPVVYLHGTLSSRLEAADLDDTARRFGLRLLAVDRPGIGGSTAIARPTMAGFADDLAQWATRNAIERFALLGLSGGGAHAACVASRHGARVSHLVLCSAIGPNSSVSSGLRTLATVSRITVAPLWAFAAFLAWLVRRKGPAMFRDGVRTRSDKRANERPNHPEILAAGWTEGTRQGGLAVARDAAAFLAPWGVALQPVSCPVDIWHGTEDPTVPLSCAQFYHAAYPGSALHLVEGEGHSLLVNHQEAVLRFLQPGHPSTSVSPSCK